MVITVVVLALAAAAASQHPLAATAARDLFQRARPTNIAFATVLMSVAFVIMGLRWRSLMPPRPKDAAAVPIGGLTLIILAGLMLNYAVPGPFGELAAAWFAHRRYGITLADAMASGVSARLIGLASASLLAAAVALCAPLEIEPAWRDAVLAGAAMVGVGGVLLLAFAARPTPVLRAVGWCCRPLQSLPVLGRIVTRGLAAGTAVAEALRRIAARGPAAALPALGWSTLGHLTVIAGIAVAVDGFDADWSMAGVAFTYAITTAGSVLLFAMPGSQFGWDALFATLLDTAAGLEPVDAMATAALVRGQQLIFMLAGAASTAVLLRGLGPPARNPAAAAGSTDEADAIASHGGPPAI